MKKMFIAAVILATSSLALAAPQDVATITAAANNTPCDGAAGAGKAKVSGGSGTVIAAGDAVFTKNGFDVQCSSNTFVIFQEVDTNLAVVAAGSSKGNQVVGGHTNGGAILPGGAAGKETDAKCTGTNDACQTSDIEKAIENAVEAGSS